MTDAKVAIDNDGVPPRGTCVLDHLVGPHRGTRQVLAGDGLRIGTGTDAVIHFPAARASSVAAYHATLRRRGDGYQLSAEPGQPVEVNGVLVEAHILTSGDVLKFGIAGPVARFRRLIARHTRYKSMGEVVEDCLECARHDGATPLGQIALFLRAVPTAVIMQTTPWARAGLTALVLALVGATALLLWRTGQLERQVASQRVDAVGIAELLRRPDDTALSVEELQRLRAGLESRLTSAEDRVDALEARNQAAQRVIATAARSVVFVQGSYGFLQPDDRQPLRIVLGPSGRPMTHPRGGPLFSTSGTGPLLERQFSGTAFVATDDGLLLTNRHIARPWEFDAAAEALTGQGLVPVMHRMIGYLPDVTEPFDVELVTVSETADVAVLRCNDVARLAAALPLSRRLVQPGEAVLVIGYPTGVRALLARSNEVFVDKLMQDEDLDFWSVAQRLSEAGHITPLATRGIVGQVTSARVVYDAETTSGGSGGPVLGLNGEVHAVNTEILAEFGGSNLGVPATEARRLLDQATGESP